MTLSTRLAADPVSGETARINCRRTWIKKIKCQHGLCTPFVSPIISCDNENPNWESSLVLSVNGTLVIDMSSMFIENYSFSTFIRSWQELPCWRNSTAGKADLNTLSIKHTGIFLERALFPAQHSFPAHRLNIQISSAMSHTLALTLQHMFI